MTAFPIQVPYLLGCEYDLEDGIVHEGDLIFSQAVGHEPVGNEVPFGDLKFFQFRVAVDMYNLHAVPKQSGHRARLVSRGNEDHLAMIKIDVQDW